MDNGKKNTSKVLTTNDIREEARNWTLAGDVGLLAHLEQFSENVITKTQETQKRFTELVDDYEELYTKVGNITNQFLALQNCQFVENRVYDEETPTEEKAVVKVQDEVEQEKLLLMQYKEAVEVGIKLLDTHFQEVQLPPNSDSDDDEISAGNSVIWKPKNPYAGKKFPLLIGSSEWWADDHVGLGATDEDILDTEKIISDSESDMESLKSADKEMKVTAPPPPIPPPSHLPLPFNSYKLPLQSSTSSSIENIKSISTKPAFPDSSSEDLFGVEKNENLKSSVSDEFFFKRGSSQEPENFLPDFEKEPEPKRKDSYDDIRPPEPSQTEDKPPISPPKKVDNAFTRELMAKLSSVTNKKEVGAKEEKRTSEDPLPTARLNAGENLFDETDDSSDLFTRRMERTEVAEAPAASKGLFFDAEVDDELFKGENDLFSGSNFLESDGLKKAEVPRVMANVSEPPKEPQKPPITESEQPKKTSTNFLFNDLDDDDTLFATRSTGKSSSPVENGPIKKSNLLVESDLGWDDDAGLFESTGKAEDDFFGSSGLFDSNKRLSKASTLSSSRETNGDLFQEEPRKEEKPPKMEDSFKKEIVEARADSRKGPAKEVAEDPFGFSPSKEPGAKKVSILESEEDEEDDLFSKGMREERKPGVKVTAFFEDEDTALFVENLKGPDSVSVSSSRSSLFDEVSASKSRLASVFDKDKSNSSGSNRAEEDLFIVAEDSLFGGEQKGEKGGKGKEKSSLFDDCDEDGEDLFGGEKSLGDSLRRTGSVFEEGRKQGGGVRSFVDDLGDEDLFKTSTKLRETKSDILRHNQSEPKMFVEDLDDGELFSSKPTVAKPKPPSSLSLKGSESEAKGKTVGKLNIPDNLKMRFESVAKHISVGGGRPSTMEKEKEKEKEKEAEKGKEKGKEKEKEEEKQDDVLDEPPQSSNLLKCPSKDRVKIPGRRRPQSRRARQEAIRNSGVWDQPTSPRSNLNTPHPSKDSLSSPAVSNPLSPSTDEEDFFKVPELDMNFEKEDQTIFNSDLFESSKTSKADDSPLFEGAPVLSPPRSSKPEESAKTGSIFDDEDDGLFATPKSPGGQLTGRSEGKVKKSLFDEEWEEDEDELFGGKSGLVASKVVSVGKGKEGGDGEGKEKKEKGRERERGREDSGFVDPLGLMSKD